MSLFPHADVREAFFEAVERPAWSIRGLTPLFAAVRSHMTTEVRDLWRAQTGGGAECVGAEDAYRERVRGRLGLQAGPAAELALTAFSAVHRRDLESFLWLAAYLSRVAFLSPETTIPVYGVLADAWRCGGEAAEAALLAGMTGPPESRLDAIDQGAPLDQAALSALDAVGPALAEPAELPPGFTDLFWRMVGEPVDATTITPKIASFAGAWPPERREAEVRAMLQYVGAAKVIDEPFERRFTLASLRSAPEGSLGRALHDLIVGNGYDLDILEGVAESQGDASAEGYHPRIDPIARRLLFTHDLFHLVGGYSTSPLHEVGIVGFQLAQFGNGYARDFLPTVLTLTTLTQPLAAWVTMQVGLEGWRHGRSNPPLICVDWNEELEKPIEVIRDELGFTPFVSKLPDVPLDMI